MSQPDPIEKLILELGRLPGIGERTAARLAFFVLKQARDSSRFDLPPLARDLAGALVDVVEQVRLCEDCQNLCTTEKCPICTDARRDARVLCVVEGVADLRAVESCGVFRGHYHVLHGSLAPLDGVGPEELKLRDILERVEHQGYKEVILATNATVEGDATALYIARLLRGMQVQITRLASGVPLGGELEYLDHATLGRALSARQSFDS